MKENRESFFARLRQPPFSSVLTARDLVLIEAMYVLAKYGHRGQFRKAPPGQQPERYFEHPRAVALILIDELQLAVALAIMLGLGHDCDEDSTQIVWEMLEALFGEDLARRARLLSKRGKDKAAYVTLLMEYGDWITLIVKGADRLHNLRTLPKDDERFCRKQVKETREKYLPLFRHMAEITPAGHRHRAQKLYDMIEALVVEHEGRFAAAASGA
jgi:(p)ppGpp synthase/HD superfamily hydrolase